MLQLDFSQFPVLHTDRLLLRALTPDDAEAMFALRSDPRAMQYVPRPLARTREDAAAHIAMILAEQKANNCIQWVIALKDDPAMMGVIGYWRMKPEHYRTELGYMLLPANWGRGIISEAIAVVVDHAFHVLGFHSIEAIVDPRNPASMRVLEKNGFVREGWFRENYFHEGKFRDSAVYSRLSPVDLGASAKR